jgi:hypothetical protein
MARALARGLAWLVGYGSFVGYESSGGSSSNCS